MIPVRFDAQEWFSENLHRSYPLADSTGGATPIPSALFADALFLISGVADSDCSLYISKLLITNAAISVYLSGQISNKTFSDVCVASFSRKDRLGATAEYSDTIEGYDVYGKIVLGDITRSGLMGGELIVTPDQGALSACCARGLPASVQGDLLVNGTRTTSPVRLEAGDGVQIEYINLTGEATVTYESLVDVVQGEEVRQEVTVTGTLVGELETPIPDELMAIFGPEGSEGTEGVDGLYYTIENFEIKKYGLEYETSATIRIGNNYVSRFKGSFSGISEAVSENVVIECTLNSIILDSVIRISVLNYILPEENTEITGDEELLARAMEFYGRPVTSVGGVAPDKDGNIYIVGDGVTVENELRNKETDEEEDSDIDKYTITVSSSSGEAGAVTITLSKPRQCDAMSLLDTLMANVAELNKRGTELATHINALDAANSNLAARLTGLV